MSESEKWPFGAIIWRDLTVSDAENVRDFYSAVVGWTYEPHNMGEYDDFDMISPGTGDRVTGICHARGPNANVPPQWLLYIVVADVDASAGKAVELGGAVLDGPREMGDTQFCVVRDPAGAVVALISQGAE